MIRLYHRRPYDFEWKFVYRDFFIGSQKASQMGIYTSIATGRMHTCAAFFGKKIDSKVPVISCNGGMMRTVDTNELIYEKYVDDCVGEEILAFLFANKVYCSWYIGMKNIAPYFSWSMFPDYTTVVPFNFIETGKDYKKYTHKITQFILRDNEKIVSSNVRKSHQSPNPIKRSLLR